MSSFSNPDGSFVNQSDGAPVRVVNPGTVATETVHLRAGERALYVANTGTTLGTLAVRLPVVESGEHVEIGVGANVATLTVTDRLGNAVAAAPAAINAGAAVDLRFVNNGWVHWR